MRSHPFEPPPPLPPILDDLATLLPLPNQSHAHRRARDDMDMDIPLREMDPETSLLLPTRPRRHHVRVQGRLAVVRSVSTANLLSPTSATAASVAAAGGGGASAMESAFDGSRGRRSYVSTGTGGGGGSPSPVTTPRFETGVGGSTRRSVEESSEEDEERDVAVRDRQLRGYGIGGVGNIRRPTEVYGLSTKHPDKKRWHLREIFGLGGQRKGKQVVENTA